MSSDILAAYNGLQDTYTDDEFIPMSLVHATEAMDTVANIPAEAPDVESYYAEAQVHATLAVAAALTELRNALGKS